VDQQRQLAVCADAGALVHVDGAIGRVRTAGGRMSASRESPTTFVFCTALVPTAVQVVIAGKGAGANMSAPALHLFVANVGTGNNTGGGNNNNNGGGNNGPFELVKLGPGGEGVKFEQWRSGGASGPLADGAVLPFGVPLNVSFSTNLTDGTSMVTLLVAPLVNNTPGEPMAIGAVVSASSQAFLNVMLPSNISQWTNNGATQFALGVVSFGMRWWAGCFAIHVHASHALTRFPGDPARTAGHRERQGLRRPHGWRPPGHPRPRQLQRHQRQWRQRGERHQ